jgi:hypothetical protein
MYTLDNCTCKLFPPHHLIHIDENIQEHIRILNDKGYRTIHCCEGHEIGSNTYISFAMNYFGDIKAPKHFVYKKNGTIVTHSYPSKLTKEELEESKKRNLELLLEWCNQLPNLRTEN